MTINLSKDEMAMIRAAAQGLSGTEVDQFIEDVRDELDSLSVTPTRNHIRAACTKVQARGK
jgi:cell division septum initiation protein DivIVA